MALGSNTATIQSQVNPLQPANRFKFVTPTLAQESLKIIQDTEKPSEFPGSTFISRGTGSKTGNIPAYTSNTRTSQTTGPVANGSTQSTAGQAIERPPQIVGAKRPLGMTRSTMGYPRKKPTMTWKDLMKEPEA